VRDIATGATLAVHAHDGRHSTAGRPGNECQRIAHNRSDADVLVVVSVDGVNVISGETASWEQPGYVVPARYASVQRASRRPRQVLRLYHDGYANRVAQGVIRPLSRRSPHPCSGSVVPDPL
jgi:hypothetical protein